MRFVDSHLHLEGPGASVAVDLGEANDTLLVTCGVDRKTSLQGLRLASSSPGVRAFVGVHPSEALKERRISWVRETLPQATGLGEVGLDPKYSAVGPRSAQMKAFLGQLVEARKLEKPIEVHSRGAENLCLDALLSIGVKRVLMHWFQSDGALPRVLDSGYLVSFGPSIVYSKKLQRMAARCDPSQVLTESDFPVGYGPLGTARGPALIPSVVFKLSEVWGLPFEDARAAVSRNAMAFLGSSEKG